MLQFFSPNSIESFLEIKENHQTGMEAVADGLRDSENLIAGMQLTEDCMFVAKPSSCINQVLQVAVFRSLHCPDNTKCEGDWR